MHTLSVDKVTTVYTLPENDDKYDHYRCLLDFMYDMAGEGHKLWGMKYGKRLAISLGETSTLLMQIGTSHHRLYAKFEYNPNKLSKNEWETLQTYLSMLFKFGYHTLYKLGRVNYIEFAADIADVEFKELFVYDERLRSANYNFESKGTTYLGCKAGRKTFCVYDKAKHLFDTQGTLLDSPLTRIEARLTGLPQTLAELSDLQNPFETLGVGLVSNMCAANGDADWKMFKKWCKHMGVQVALEMAGKGRKKALEKLREIVSPDLHPASCWPQLSTALNVMRPANFIH